MKKSILLLLSILCIFSCKTTKNYTSITLSSKASLVTKKTQLKSKKNWHLKDIETDTLPGISLNRSYATILKNKRGKDIIIAVIDTEVDIHHKDLQNTIWVNESEIPNNGIDDDKNGYIDDVYGWNFLGNKKGENNRFINFEYTRILKQTSKDFKNLTPKDAVLKNEKKLQLHNRAKEAYDKRMQIDSAGKANYDKLYTLYFEAKNKIYPYLKERVFNQKSVDSLKKLKPEGINDFHFFIWSDCLKNNINDALVTKYRDNANERINKMLNLAYNDRSIQGDNENDISDTDYGNNNVSGNIDFLEHGTKMAGIIANITKNTTIKIMPIAISAYGDENDKDIALAIRYAVDNNAKVINMSFGKEFSTHKKWVDDAIKYAEKNNVLIVSSAGNFGNNLNIESHYYPNDRGEKDSNISDNFLLIGASTYTLNKKLKAKNSNYGNIDVDLFAPGTNIFTTNTQNRNTFSGGTSSAAAITSGVAALLYAYYPSLNASQIKSILMNSGIAYTIPVSTPEKDDKSKLTPFNQLSKSGKILNAYNAFIMAEKITK
ncbi:S8 family serine peptidase [Tenacibaculum amylolyticum]|uniref:S8 family serine peptidase n=1 Tax=Tenacibaculum amylolyticum TaxID=104269 RepID=UPI003892FBB6